MMAGLAEEAFSLAGAPPRTYARDETPIVRRPWRVAPPLSSPT